MQVIVEEAGGRFTDLGGVSRIDGGSAVDVERVAPRELLASLGAQP